MRKIIIDPITRVSGLLGIEVEIENDVIVSAKCKGNQFRGFEMMFEGRDPLDMIRLAPRICGICSTHHTLASTLALEEVMKVTPDQNGKLARDITNAFEFLQNHIRQLYFFAIPDYVYIRNLNPLTKTVLGPNEDYRLPDDITTRINNNLNGAARCSRLAHKAIAYLAGKIPHCHGIYIGGITTDIGIEEIEGITYCINEICNFINNEMKRDINDISKYYNDYFNIGRGYGNFIDAGVFEGYSSDIKYSDAGVLINGVKGKLDVASISESVYNSWLETSGGTVTPGVTQPPFPNAYKKNGYSWVTAPRYKGYALEGGPLARMIINGYYTRGISAMDRLVARAMEASRLCESIKNAIKLLKVQKPYQEVWKVPESGKGVGLVGASRGCLGHWIDVENSKVKNYTIIPPSAWNLSPTDEKGVRGPVEEALVGTRISNGKTPVEIGRIVRSFDPCLNCAAHVISDKYEPMTIEIL